MTNASRGSMLAVFAALALAGCGDRGANGNNQADAVGAPDMASDTGMNAADTTMTDTSMMNGSETAMNGSSTVDMSNAGTSTDAANTSGNATNTNGAPY